MNERAIFEGALDHADPAKRQAYLDRACGTDAALRARVEALLASHAAVSGFLNVPAWEQLNPPADGRRHQTLDFTGASGADARDDDNPEDDPHAAPDLSFLQPSSKTGSIGTLGHYEILQVLGQGAFGIVFKAFDEKLQRFVAIKAINPQLAATSPPRKRFLREARSAAAIKHENIVQVYSVEEQPLPYIVMEYVEGQTLQQKLDGSGPLEIQEILHLGRQMASGLAAAHARGLIHRDIKPGNILLEQGAEQRVKISDFGLARAADDASMTRSGFISGTPMYMAPEQAQGLALDHRADLFSLGSVLYQMASGRAPFRAATAMAVLKRVTDESPRPIQEIIAEVPDWLCAIIGKLHAKKPEERFQSAQDLADLLVRCQSELQQHGRVEALGDMLPILPKPAVAKPLQHEGARSGEMALPTPASRPAHSRSRRWALAAAVIGVLFAGLSLTEATGVTNLRGTVIRLFSPDGTLIVEVDDPGVSVTIDGEEMVITGTGAKEIRLKPGQYKLLASRDGKLVRQELVTVTKNGRQVVRVSKEAAPVAELGKVEIKDLSPSEKVDVPSTTVAPPLLKAPFIKEEAERARADWAAYLKIPERKHLDLPEGIKLEVVLIPPGRFHMGTFGDNGTERMHPVTISKPFYMAVTETTQEQYMAVGGTSNKSAFSPQGRAKDKLGSIKDTSKFPADCVNWFDAQAFAKRIDAQLPTEAQWEYACRAGTITDFHFGKLLNGTDANCKGTEPYGTNEKGPNLDRTAAVGSYQPNAFGLHDMHGNLWEWCLDWYADNTDDLGEMDPVRTIKKFYDRRVMRGGSWDQPAWQCRSARRGRGPEPEYGGGVNGFRVVIPISDHKVEIKELPSPKTEAVPPKVVLPPPAKELEALRRDKISPEALAAAGDGDPNKAPACLVAVLGEPRPIHTQSVIGLAFSSDGRWLASGSDDRTILLTEAATGRVSRVLKGHTGRFTSLAFSQKDRVLVSASHDRTIRLWPVDTDAPPQMLQPKLGEIVAMAASPDGRYLAAGGATGAIKLWKWGQWDAGQDLVSGPGSVNPNIFTSDISLAFSADGERLAFSRHENAPKASIQICRTADGKVAQTLPGHAGRVNGLAFSRDGEFLASVGDDRLAIVWDLAAGRPFAELQDNRYSRSVAFSADGKTLAVNSASLIVLYDLASRTRCRRIFQSESGCRAVCYSADGKRIAASGATGSVQVWDTGTWEQLYVEGGHRHAIATVAVSRDGRTVLSGGSDSTVRRWPLDRPGKSQFLCDSGAGMVSVACSADDGTYLLGNGDTGVLWDARSGKERCILESRGHRQLDFSADGKTVAGVGDGRSLCLWNTTRGAMIHKFSPVGSVRSIGLSADGRFLAASYDGQDYVKVWVMKTGAEAHSLPAGSPIAVALSPDGRLLATGQPNNSISLWDLADDKKIRTFHGQRGLTGLKFTPDGKTLISSGEGTIHLWDPSVERPSEERAHEVIHLGPANQPLCFDIDASGKYLVAAGTDPLIFVLRLP